MKSTKKWQKGLAAAILGTVIVGAPLFTAYADGPTLSRDGERYDVRRGMYEKEGGSDTHVRGGMYETEEHRRAREEADREDRREHEDRESREERREHRDEHREEHRDHDGKREYRYDVRRGMYEKEGGSDTEVRRGMYEDKNRPEEERHTLQR